MQDVGIPATGIEDKAQDTVYLYYTGGIDQVNVENIMTTCAKVIEMVKPLPSAIQLMISSVGGEVNAGIYLYHALGSLPLRIIMYNMGNIDSIANVAFVAGDERYAVKNSTFLFHGVGSTVTIGTRLTRPLLEALLSSFKKDEDKIAGIVADKTHITVEKMQELFKKGEIKDAVFAKEQGLIHEIRFPIIPSGARVHNIQHIFPNAGQK